MASSSSCFKGLPLKWLSYILEFFFPKTKRNKQNRRYQEMLGWFNPIEQKKLKLELQRSPLQSYIWYLIAWNILIFAGSWYWKRAETFSRLQIWKHCQRHNGPEGWVLVTKVTSLGHITSSHTNLDQTRPSTNFKISIEHQHFDKTS